MVTNSKAMMDIERLKFLSAPLLDVVVFTGSAVVGMFVGTKVTGDSVVLSVEFDSFSKASFSLLIVFLVFFVTSSSLLGGSVGGFVFDSIMSVSSDVSARAVTLTLPLSDLS